MIKYCADCGSPIPENQGSRTCSRCYGDPEHGKDGYLRADMEEDARYEEEKEQQNREADNT